MLFKDKVFTFCCKFHKEPLEKDKKHDLDHSGLTGGFLRTYWDILLEN